MTNPIVKINRFEDAVLGGAAGVFSGMFTNPFEVVKVRLQLLGADKKPLYNGVSHAFKSIISGEGIRGFYTGLPAFMFYQFFLNGTRLSVYSGMFSYMQTLEKNSGISPLIKSVCAGGVAGICASVVANPFSIAKTRQQKISMAGGTPVYPQGFSGVYGILSEVVNKEGGFRSLFKGISANTPRMFIGSACQLTVFEASKRQIALRTGYQGPIANACASLCAALFYGLCTAPFDLIATRMYASTTANTPSAFAVGAKVIKEEGVLSFWRGAGPIMMRHAPHATIMLTTWEELRRIYAKRVKGYEGGFEYIRK
eukprot:GDKJ01032845.1.p1 GENE.GDKJ01032845.1~~GDKJ01032845.1.p1  ORF type:complete len:312 (-),score=51.31 GDKJ01032845.1:27-962(-)